MVDHVMGDQILLSFFGTHPILKEGCYQAVGHGKK
jgi:hypothetical protein